MFQRRRRSLLSDRVDAVCSTVRQRNVQCSQILSSWFKSPRNGGSSTNFDLMLSSLSIESATRLHISVVFRLLASENCSDRQNSDPHIASTDEISHLGANVWCLDILPRICTAPR